MLSDDEKYHIVERVQFENALRKELTEKSEPKKFVWLENKITLLIVGALLTGVCVPTFQYTQKLWDVKRQNQFNNLTFTLNAMRDCLREFTYLTALSAEARQRAEPLFKHTKLTKAEYDSFEHDYVDLQKRRCDQTAKVISLMSYFRDNQEIALPFEQDYSTALGDYLQRIDQAVALKACASGVNVCGTKGHVEVGLAKTLGNLDVDLARLNAANRNVASKMREQIGRKEDEGIKFGL
jgi:hypothetical protein